MADYDVGALALTNPPAKAVITSYRPAVSVRNNGIHDALASGTLRIYSAGLLTFTTELYSPTIPPGETKAATATDYWTPPSVGVYQVIAYVSCPLDQFEPNNALAPTLVTVTTEPPPPAPAVALHASQHEEGATDELSIDGLAGRAKDPQVPFDHVANHEPGGSDELDVTDLHGRLADAQPPAVHGNDFHAPPFATYANISEVVNAHDAFGTVHAASTNLEHTANKGAANGYPGLGSNALVPPAQLGGVPPTETLFLRADSTWQPAAAGTHAETHETGGADEINVGSLHGTLADPQPPESHSSAAHDSSVEATANKGAAGGYPNLDGTTMVPAEQLGTFPTPPPIQRTEVLHMDQNWRNPAPAEPTAHHESHETGGGDDLSVAGLHGQLGDLQPVKAHHDSHAAGGSDPINVAGLSGVLAEPQTPENHAASAHDTSVEATAHKGAASGYAPLDAGSKVPVANLPGMPPTAHATTHVHGGTDELSIAGLSGKTADAQTPVNHGATHGHEGGDDISIGGLSGMPAAAGVALGLATLDIDGKLTAGQAPPGLQPTSEKGQADGYCPLGPDTKVPSAYLPPSPPPATTGLELLHYVPVEYTFSNPDELSHDFGHFLVPNLAEGSIVTVDAYGTFTSPMAGDVITLLINEPMGNAVATATHGVQGDNTKRSWHMHIEMVINLSQNGGPYYKWKYNSMSLRSDPTITNNNIVFRETLIPPYVDQNTEYPVVLTRDNPLSTVTLNYLRVCHIHP